MSTRVINIRSLKTVRPEGLGYVYIGRGSKWGNPFTHLPLFRDDVTIVGSRQEAIERYEAYLRSRPDLMAALPELRGKVLGCYCKPAACHGDVLARLANA